MGSKIKKADLDAMIREVVGPEIAKLREELNKPVTDNTRGLVGAANQPGNAGESGPSPGGTRDGDEKTERRLALARIAKASRIARGDPERMVRVLREQGYERTAATFQRALTGNTMADGAIFLPPTYAEEFIEMLRPMTVVRQAGARTLPLDGTLEIGRQNGGAVARWGEEGGTTRASQPTTGSVKLVEKKLTVIVPVGNKLIYSANRSAEQFVTDDMLAGAAVETDAKHLRGDGSQSAPKGLRYLCNAANVFQRTQAGGQNTVVTATNDLTRAVRQVAQANIPMKMKDSFAWFLSSRSYWWLHSLRDGNNNLVFGNEMDNGRLLGFPVYDTQQVPDNLGAGGNESEVIFAAMPQVIIGDSPAVRVEAIPDGTYVDANGNMVSGVSNDETVFRLVLYTDIALRHDRAVSVITTVDWV
jgi:HK97 family phage major capsid protein